MSWKKIVTATGALTGTNTLEPLVSSDVTNKYVDVTYTQGELEKTSVLTRFTVTDAAAQLPGKTLKYFAGACVTTATGAETAAADEAACNTGSVEWMPAGMYWAADMDAEYFHPGDSGNANYSSAAFSTNNNSSPYLNESGSVTKTSIFTADIPINAARHLYSNSNINFSSSSLSLYNLALGYSGTNPNGTSWTSADTHTNGTLASDANMYVHSADHPSAAATHSSVTTTSVEDAGNDQVVDNISLALTTSGGHVTNWVPPAITARTLSITSMPMSGADSTTFSADTVSGNDAYNVDSAADATAIGGSGADKYENWSLKVGASTLSIPPHGEVKFVIGSRDDLPTLNSYYDASPLVGEPFLTQLSTYDSSTDSITIGFDGDYGSGGKVKDVHAGNGMWMVPGISSSAASHASAEALQNAGAVLTGWHALLKIGDPAIDLTTAVAATNTNASATTTPWGHTHHIVSEWDLSQTGGEAYDSGSSTWTKTLIRTRLNTDSAGTAIDGAGASDGTLYLQDLVITDQLLDSSESSAFLSNDTQIYNDVFPINMQIDIQDAAYCMSADNHLNTDTYYDATLGYNVAYYALQTEDACMCGPGGAWDSATSTCTTGTLTPGRWAAVAIQNWGSTSSGFIFGNTVANNGAKIINDQDNGRIEFTGLSAGDISSPGDGGNTVISSHKKHIKCNNAGNAGTPIPTLYITGTAGSKTLTTSTLASFSGLMEVGDAAATVAQLKIGDASSSTTDGTLSFISADGGLRIYNA